MIRELGAQFKESYFGIAWMFARPLLLLVVYTVVFGIVWPRDGDGLPLGAFAMQMFCGLSFYNMFAASVSSSTSSVLGRVGFVKQVVFPLETLPFTKTLTQFVLSLAWLVLLLFGTWFIFGRVPLTCLMLPLIVIPLFLFSNGVAWFVGALTVYVRDLKMFVPIVLQILFFITPIFWQLDQFQGDRAVIVKYLYLNPLTGVVEAARDVMIRGVQPDWYMLGLLTLVGFVAWHLGYVWFSKTKKGFADVI